MSAKMVNDSMIKGKFKAWLAFYIVTLSFVFIFLITLYPTAQKAASNDIILGFILGTGLASIISFFFGSSDKNKPDPEPERIEED